MVIAIVGILASLLLPTVRDGHALSQTTQCKANQRLLVFAATGYRNDHSAHPPTVLSMQVHWDDASILWNYMDNTEEKMACPEYEDFNYSTTGYNYNAMLGDEYQVGSGIIVKGIPISDCSHPARCAIFGDGHHNKFMRATLSNASIRCGGRQAYRHNGETVIAWLDGHISSQRHAFNNNCDDNELVGFLSEDNSAYDPRILQLNQSTQR